MATNYLQFYEDSACTRLWKTVPCVELLFNSIQGHGGQPGILTIGGIAYNYYDWEIRTIFIGAEEIMLEPFLTIHRPDEERRTVYCRNGFSMIIGSSPQGTVFGDFRYNGEPLPFANEDARSGRYWAIAFYDAVTGKNYVGFTRDTDDTWSGTAETIACVEVDFWNDAFRPSYDYGSGTDAAGGQGDGKIPHSDIPLTENPGRIMPFGGHGLHAYRVDLSAFNSIQGFLWGESSTIAKSLWQKFMNHTHTPVQCIVGAYSLPEPFMPSGAAASGVQLGGMMLKPIAGSCQDVTGAIGFLTTELYTFTTAPEPFHSWLDYTGIQAILHIPFCGTIQIAAEYVIKRKVQFRYRVDQLNGNVVAIVYAAGRVIAEISGNCAYTVPVSGGDDGTLQRLGATLSGVLQLAAGNYGGALSSAAEAASAVHHTQLVNSDMHGSMTACENRVPYIEWIYPTTAYTPDYYRANGVPCEFSGTLSAFAGGYGEFEVLPASLNIPDATAAEKEEIAALLRGGVIV